MAALLTSVTSSTDEVVKYINECREMSIAVEPPDINVSDANFTPHGEAIRFGLAAVKNVGHNAIESIVAGRKKARYTSFFDFCESVDLRLLNKRVLESLIKSGAMDALGSRSQLMAVVDKAIERAQKAQRDAESGQHGLFGVFNDDSPAASQPEKLPDVPEWDEFQRLAAEKEILGFFITGHPMEKYADKLADLRALDTRAINEMKQGTGKDEIKVAGMLTGVKPLKSKKGEMYAQAFLEDMAGKIDVLVFPEAYRRLSEKLKFEVPVLVSASVRIEEGAAPKLAISQITPLDEVQPKLPNSIRIRVPLETATNSTIDALQSLCVERKGGAKVLFDLEHPRDFLVVLEAEGYNVQADRAFISRVEELCGRNSVRVID
jgi:DNA polymerase-3 subunit alpha